ncbi:cytochrome bc complex cytochrome b subunit [Nonomuraea sp. NBC_01738]|uniref:cytochrome b n=1 Tax=Nonomuraea sp. NBC_01738 TaxID=2976003 RepID=UPI002E14A220|nr:cytochrome bc complex cytochrome b subunit [Nonomuraea sp. NBC_01738]
MATPTKQTRRDRLTAGSARAATGGVKYVDDRLGLGRWLRPNLRKLFPTHWSFLLGEFALYSFVLLVLTGTFLTLFYKPNPDVAFESVRQISLEVRSGLLVRQLHHWSAMIFVFSIVLHLFRVFFTGAFRRPRELTWMLGVLLFALVLFESFLGVSLPADQLGLAGLREAQGMLLSIPLVGTYLSAFVFDGPFPGEVIPRVFVTHVLLVPGILLAVVPLHALILTWRQKHTERRRASSDESRVTGVPFFPSFAVKQGITSLGTFTVIAALATFVTVNPIWEHGPYLPGRTPPSAQPFWYFGALEGLLRLTPAWDITLGGYTLPVGLWIPGLVMGAFFTILFFYPFLERRLSGDRRVHNLLDRPSEAPVRTALGFAAITFFLVAWSATWFTTDLSASPPLLTVTEPIFQTILYGLRIAIFVLPAVAFAVALVVCRRRLR